MLFAGVPLLLATALATVSTACDELENALARVRLEAVRDGRDAWLVSSLHEGLHGLHLGKGLGVTIPGTGVVLDTAFLQMAMLQLGKVLAVVVPLVLALQPVAHRVAHARVCGLDPALKAFVDSCVESYRRVTPQENIAQVCIARASDPWSGMPAFDRPTAPCFVWSRVHSATTLGVKRYPVDVCP